MAKARLFGEVLEVIDTFSLEDQETLKEILQSLGAVIMRLGHSAEHLSYVIIGL